MEHFYGSDDIDPDTLEDLDLGDDGKVRNNEEFYSKVIRLLRLVMMRKICFIQIERNLIQELIMMKANIRM
jgi:hypothetical protein